MVVGLANSNWRVRFRHPIKGLCVGALRTKEHKNQVKLKFHFNKMSHPF